MGLPPSLGAPDPSTDQPAEARRLEPAPTPPAMIQNSKPPFAALILPLLALSGFNALWAKMRVYSVVAQASFPADLQSNLSLHPWQKGYLDVTKAPFNAVGNGINDDSDEIQKAIDYAFWNNFVVYFPAGTYLVSKTLNCIQEDGENFTPPTGKGQRKFAHLLVGSTTGPRPVIKVANGSTLTNNRLLNFIWADTLNNDGNNDGVDDPSRHYCALFRGIDIDMGSNPAATALYMNAAQDSSIEDVKIYGTAFNAGLENIPGSGGYVTNVWIVGGNIGILQNNYRPNPTVMGLTLENQSQYGLKLLHTRGPLGLIGFKITSPASSSASYRAILTSDASGQQNGAAGNLNLVDGQIEVTGSGKAIENQNQDTYIDNVYFKAATIIESGSVNAPTDTITGSASTWKKLTGYVFASGTDNSYVYVDGVHLHTGTGADYVSGNSLVNENPPTDLLSRHLYGTMPSWQDANVIDITAAPYNATPENGFTGTNDDGPAIQAAIDYAVANNKVVFVPRGHFHLSSPIQLKAGLKMIGAGKNISAIQVSRNWQPTSPVVAIDSDNIATASLRLQDLAFISEDPSATNNTLSHQNMTLLRIQSGDTIWRSVQTDRVDSGTDCVYVQPMIIFANNAGGRIYGLNMDLSTRKGTGGSIAAGYRQCKISGTGAQALTIYQFDEEYVEAAPQTEIASSANVTLFGFKMEDNWDIMRISSSTNIRIIGASGNEIANPATMFELTGTCSAIILANLSHAGGGTLKWVTYGAQSVGEDKPLALFKLSGTTPNITTASLPGTITGESYSQTLAATGGNGTLVWSVSAGSLPAGLTLSASGVISGSATTAGTSNFTVRVADTDGDNGPSDEDTQALSIVVTANSVPNISTTTLPGATVGTAYSQTLAATGGNGTLVWSLSTGSLPAGFSLSTGGVISGTPTTTGTSNFTVKVADSDGNVGAADEDTQALSIVVSSGAVGIFSSNEDIGSPGLAGSASFNSGTGTYTVTGGGADIFGTGDQFRYVHQSWTGDGRIVARVVSQTTPATNNWAKGGVMFRDDTAANARFMDQIVAPNPPVNGSIQMVQRVTAGATAVEVGRSDGKTMPYWVRLERHGNLFTGWHSIDGLTWFVTGSATLALNNPARVGLAVTAHDNTKLNTATFDGVTLAAPPAWTAADIGSVGAAGSTSVDYATDLFTLNGAGANIFGTADSFHYYYLPWTAGDATIVAEVTSVENTHQNAKGGLMIRQSLANNAQNALVDLKPGTGAAPGVEFMRRTTSGGSGAHSSGSPVASITPPRFLKLVRSGNNFSAYYSSDSVTWTQVGVTESITMTGTVYIGLVSCSIINTSNLCTATFESVYVK